MTWMLAHLAFIVVTALTLIATGTLLRERRAPQATLAWLLAIVLVPYVGLPLYLALGARKERRPSIPFPAFPTTDAVPLGEAHAADRLLRRYGLPGASTENAFRLLGTGEVAYAALIDLVEGAERSVWVTLFILGDDDAGRGFLEALTRRANDGLNVRLLLDAVGSRPLPKARLAPLRAAGGHIAFFEPVLHRPFRGRTNLRNHRKIFLADERRVLAGGMNVAHEYMGPTSDAARWHDLAFRLDGPTVAAYAALFRSDWAFASHLPVLGVLFGLGVGVYGFIRKEEAVLRVALGVFVLVAVAAFASGWTGDKAEHVLEEAVPTISEQAIHAHEDMADKAAISSYLLGVLALVTLGLSWGKPLRRPFVLGTLAVSVVVSGLMGYMANLGGEIRHTEATTEVSTTSAPRP